MFPIQKSICETCMLLGRALALPNLGKSDFIELHVAIHGIVCGHRSKLSSNRVCICVVCRWRWCHRRRLRRRQTAQQPRPTNGLLPISRWQCPTSRFPGRWQCPAPSGRRRFPGRWQCPASSGRLRFPGRWQCPASRFPSRCYAPPRRI